MKPLQCCWFCFSFDSFTYVVWQVRRQRQVEQELTLKDCQKKTEQLQLWLTNIAQTLDHVTRINDQSQIEVNLGRFENLNKSKTQPSYTVTHYSYRFLDRTAFLLNGYNSRNNASYFFEYRESKDSVTVSAYIPLWPLDSVCMCVCAVSVKPDQLSRKPLAGGVFVDSSFPI